MTQLLALDGLDVHQKNFQQILIRGDGKEQFNQLVNKELAISPPTKNLELMINEKYLFS